MPKENPCIPKTFSAPQDLISHAEEISELQGYRTFSAFMVSVLKGAIADDFKRTVRANLRASKRKAGSMGARKK